MICDIAFIDAQCAKAYSFDSIEKDSLGGTESTTIRVVEGSAKIGKHRIIVVQKRDFSPHESPNGVMYVPWSWLDVVKPKVVIHLRSRIYIDKFPYAKQYIWMHDAVSFGMNNIVDWATYCTPLNVNIISVSDWHTTNILSVAPELNVKRIYSPIEESFISYPQKGTYDRNQLVWMSSPHKGLDTALDMFQDLLKMNPDFKLIVFNPGYHKQAKIKYPRVAYLSETTRENIKSIVSQSLAVFFPTRYHETLGMFAMEANALGCPVACMNIAALAESVNNEYAKDEDGVIDLVASWYYQGRPSVTCPDKFRFENIYPQWAQVFAGAL